MQHSPELQHEIAAALSAKGSDYRPRTRHLDQGKPLYTNRLIFEDSPYLLQHAHNPVDWFPWGEEAFARARQQHKPVFLSIGYATCHWCHVMEEESFENIKVAALLNEHFIAVKVDREQYPDIDQAYMTAVQLLTGRGGWPMSSFLTPAGEPFFGGTYFSAASFADLLTQVQQAWNDRRETLLQQAEQVADAVRAAVAARAQLKAIDQTSVQQAVTNTLARYDARYGGFSGAPKFPNEPLLLLLLQAYRRRHDPALIAALKHTLSAMAQGGIYDQVGGGFHRYSVDERWLVPHFEKMLYNQAYLAAVYSRAYRLTGDELYGRVVRQTLDYVLRELTTGDGLFVSATDADSEGREGTYFVWSKDEIEALLDPADAELIIALFGVSEAGNFEGKNILHLPAALTEVAERQGVTFDALLARLDPLLATMREYRNRRIPPLTDSKIITAWNAMMAAALAEASVSLGDSRYLEAAERAAAALWTQQRPQPGTLWRVCLNGRVSIAARQDDYAHFSDALLALYDATGSERYLQQAAELAEEMRAKFTDDSGVLIMGRDKLLFAQPADVYDGALPSGNAVAVRVWSRLAVRTGDARYNEAANRLIRACAGGIERQPEAYAYLLAQLDQMRHGESGFCRYAAGGAVKITAELTPGPEYSSLRLGLNIRDGWSIQAEQTARPDRTATEISLADGSQWRLERVDYPEAQWQTPAFENEAQAVYRGGILIQATLSNPEPQQPVTLIIRLQACNQDSCFPAETIEWAVFPAH